MSSHQDYPASNPQPQQPTIVHVSQQPDQSNPIYESHLSEDEKTYLRDAATIPRLKDTRIYLFVIAALIPILMGVTQIYLDKILWYQQPGCEFLCSDGMAPGFNTLFLSLFVGIAVFHLIDVIHILSVYPLRSQPRFPQIKNVHLQTICYFMAAGLAAFILLFWGLSLLSLGQEYTMFSEAARKSAIASAFVAGAFILGYIVLCLFSVKRSTGMKF